jgi:hypothetical protein
LHSAKDKIPETSQLLAQSLQGRSTLTDLSWQCLGVDDQLNPKSMTYRQNGGQLEDEDDAGTYRSQQNHAR